ncbi:hypothetical protein DL95DRAFT_490596 [Leptodontidium sp. 2 PMI_412]|nr:hypothetical protein DL95DRAFT_490596 [Leptodontidium sp. 2 PMI_412]
MSTPDLAAPTAPGISLGDLISTTAFESEENMADEIAPNATTPVTETQTKVKPARKTPVKKSKVVAEDGENGDVVSGDGETETPAKVKNPRKTPVKKENVKPKEGEEADAEEPTTPKAAAPKKRGPNKKKGDATPATPATPTGAENGDVNMTTPATNGGAKSSGKKRGPVKAADGETPTKKPKAAPGETPDKRAKAAAVKFPECWAEFTEEDKLIVNMRKANKGWIEIENAWAELSGKKPGKDSIRKRYPRLEAVSQDFKDEDLLLISDAKKIVDEETEVAIKKIKADAWNKIGERVKAAGGDDYKGAAIEKKWAYMKKNNQINDKGEYIVPAAVEEVDEDMENLTVADEPAATNGNGHVEDEVEADAMEE